MRGRIEDFKEEFIVKMLSNPETKDTFARYCLDGKISEETKERVENYKKYLENKEKAILLKKQAKRKNKKEKKVFPEVSLEERTNLLNDQDHNRINNSEALEKIREEKMKYILQRNIQEIESVSEEVYSFNPGKDSDLGKNLFKNIQLRLKESNFTLNN